MEIDTNMLRNIYRHIEFNQYKFVCFNATKYKLKIKKN